MTEIDPGNKQSSKSEHDPNSHLLSPLYKLGRFAQCCGILNSPPRRSIKMSSTQVVEIFHMPIKPGEEIDSTMRKLAEISFNTPGGTLALYWGVQLEDLATLDIIAGTPFFPPSSPFPSTVTNGKKEWESLEQHKSFLASDKMKASRPLLMSLWDTTRESETYHITSSPDLDKVLTSPGVEICRFKNTPETFEDKVGKFHEEVKTLEVQRGVVNGWIIEEEKGKVMVALVAWDSVEAHGLAMQDVHILKELEKAQEHMGDVEMHHVVLTKYVT